MGDPKESEIQRMILEWLKAKKIFAKRIPTQGLRNSRTNPAKGCPDIIGVLPGGRSLAIEVKSKSGRLSDDQKDWLNQSAEAGAMVIVAQSLDDVINALEIAV